MTAKRKDINDHFRGNLLLINPIKVTRHIFNNLVHSTSKRKTRKDSRRLP